MEQLQMEVKNTTQQESAPAAVIQEASTATENTEAATPPIERSLEPGQEQVKRNESIIRTKLAVYSSGSLRGNQNLQISKPNKSIDVYFRTEDPAEFFINKHVEIIGKPIPFIHKGHNQRYPSRPYRQRVTCRLYDYVEHLCSIRHVDDMNYKGATFYDGTRQVFVTQLTQHIPRSLKIGNRWCLVFYRDKPVPHRRPPRVPTIVVTPSSEGTTAQMEWEEPGQGTSADNMSDANSEDPEESQRTIVDEPMPAASLTS